MDFRVLKRLAMVLVALALLSVPSCSGENPTITTATYDQSCSSNADCKLVWTGDVCTCDNIESINSKEVDRFETERTDLQEDCGSIPDCSSSTSDWRGVCNAGTCTVDRKAMDVVDDTGGGDTTPDATDTAGSSDDTGDDTGGDTSEAGDADTAGSSDADGGGNGGLDTNLPDVSLDGV